MAMSWKTRITEMMGIQYPIIMGSYGGFGKSELAGPVSEAGALGMITAGALRTPEGLREDIRKIRTMTNKPFAVNLSHGSDLDMMGCVKVIIEEKVPVVETSVFRSPEIGKALKDAGIVWIHKVATLKHAVGAARDGADAVVIVSMEGTGFKSAQQLTTFIGTPMAADMVGNTPLITAGGIGDGRSFMAALALGAEAAYLGTALMATTECPISDTYKQKLMNWTPADQEFRDKHLAPPKQENIKDLMAQAGAKQEAGKDKDAWLRSLEQKMLQNDGEVTKKENWFHDPEEILKVTPGSLAVAHINKIVSAKEMIDTIIKDAEAIRTRWASM